MHKTNNTFYFRHTSPSRFNQAYQSSKLGHNPDNRKLFQVKNRTRSELAKCQTMRLL